MSEPPPDVQIGGYFLEQNVDVDVPCLLSDGISSYTGDFMSLERSVDPTDAAVQTAIRTVRGSGSAVQNSGQKFGEHTHVDGDLSSYFLEESRFALQHLIAAGQVQLDHVEVVTFDNYRDTAEIWLHYTNLARQRSGKALLMGSSARTS